MEQKRIPLNIDFEDAKDAQVFIIALANECRRLSDRLEARTLQLNEVCRRLKQAEENPNCPPMEFFIHTSDGKTLKSVTAVQEYITNTEHQLDSYMRAQDELVDAHCKVVDELKQKLREKTGKLAAACKKLKKYEEGK